MTKELSNFIGKTITDIVKNGDWLNIYCGNSSFGIREANLKNEILIKQLRDLLYVD